jgi:hypothetical protein
MADKAGPVMVDRTRAYLRKALSWYGERDDQFNLTAAFVRVKPRLTPAMITGITKTRDRLGMVTLLSTPIATTVAAAVIAIEARQRNDSNATGPKRGVGIWCRFDVLPQLRFNIGHRFNSCPALGGNSSAEEQTSPSVVAALMS